LLNVKPDMRTKSLDSTAKHLSASLPSPYSAFAKWPTTLSDAAFPSTTVEPGPSVDMSCIDLPLPINTRFLSPQPSAPPVEYVPGSTMTMVFSSPTASIADWMVVNERFKPTLTTRAV
jgi:hypothetical protein